MFDDCDLGQPGGCEWTIRYLWRWTNAFGRIDVIVLALMFACIVCVVAHVSFRYHSVRRTRDIDTGLLSQLVADLSAEAGLFHSIASTAPYLGLAGTCVGILSAFGAFAMEKHTLLLVTVTKVATALVPSVVAILVAVTATFSYNYLGTRIDLLHTEVGAEQGTPYFRVFRRFALLRRFSQLPAFGLLAAPALTLLVAAYLPFAFRPTPTGFRIELASSAWESDGDDRLVLHVTNTGKLFLNTEQENWNAFAGRLSEIYRTRGDNSLYLIADDGVPFQTVADAIDAARKNLDIRVRLIEPRTMNTHCPTDAAASSAHHGSR